MKVKEVIEQLQKLDQEMDVIMFSDAEGNDINDVDCVYFEGNCVALVPV